MNQDEASAGTSRSRRRLLKALGLGACALGAGGCEFRRIIPNTEMLTPRDSFLTPPSMIDSRREFGYLGTVSTYVPATASIFLAGAEDGTRIESPDGHLVDTAPDNSPVIALKGMLRGGETLDIFANGEARHVPTRSISFGPRGWTTTVLAGPANDINEVEGPIGALVGMFNNQRQPFVIGQRMQITAPRSSRFIYLALLDFPGSSSNNELGFDVSIEVIRR